MDYNTVLPSEQFLLEHHSSQSEGQICSPERNLLLRITIFTSGTHVLTQTMNIHLAGAQSNMEKEI